MEKLLFHLDTAASGLVEAHPFAPVKRGNMIIPRFAFIARRRGRAALPRRWEQQLAAGALCPPRPANGPAHGGRRQEGQPSAAPARSVGRVRQARKVAQLESEPCYLIEHGRAERARMILERAPSFWKETLHLKVGFAFLWKRARSREALVRETKPWTPERIPRDNGYAERARGI